MPSFGLALGILVALTIVRLIGLHFSVVDLFYDESQYWAWSRELAFGYYSKPPLLSYIIAVADHVCGDNEACVRAPAPILYLGMSLVIYAVARELYDARVAFFAAVSAGLATGVAFSARIMTTDVPLLFCWSLALLAYVKLLAGGTWRWAVVLGASLGLGILAKYAMVYFLLGVVLAAWFDRDARRLLRAPSLWIGLAIAVLLLAPNTVWNAEHGFATLREIGSNAEGEGVKIDVLRGLGFLASQFAVFGPIVFAVVLIAIACVTSAAVSRADRLMLAFAVPPLALIFAVATMTHANANWAAPAFVSAVVVATALLVRHNAWKWLAASIACGVIVQAALLVADAMATRVHVPFIAAGDVYYQTLGWRSFGEQTGQLARRIGARSIVGDIHFEVASLLYYWRDQPQQILSWPNGLTPEDNFDLTRPFTDSAPEPILYVTACTTVPPLSDYFKTVVPLGHILTPGGPTTWHYFQAFELYGPRKPIAPRGKCVW